MSDDERIPVVEGKVVLGDGTESEFMIQLTADGSFTQWGANMQRLARSVEFVAAMADALRDALAEEDDPPCICDHRSPVEHEANCPARDA